MTQEVERPPLSLTLSTGQKIKMSYGLEMDIRRMLPDPSSAMQLALNDPFIQDYIIRRALTSKNAMITDEADLVTDVELEPDDTEALVVWMVSHVLFFFVSRAKALAKLTAQYEIEAPSDNGSKNSPSTTPSAGPSE